MKPYEVKNTSHLACKDRRDLPLQLVDLKVRSSKAGDAFTFSGYGSIWDRVDSYGDTVLAGAFAESIKARPPMMFFGHMPNRVPGKWIEYAEDSKGLLLTGELTPGHSEAKDLEASLRHGSITGLSIGGYTKEAEWIQEGDEFVGRRIKSFDLFEVSVVSMPAETEARIDAATVKAALQTCNTLRALETYLREQGGFSRAAAEEFLRRCRELTQGDPAEQRTELAGQLVETMRAVRIPTSLLES